ncbi:MAG: caspase family protein, partial [Tolypothrix sp. T3-bin4]|nr:caspase family protein [Tolypothrix sp. T3-bin4]
MAKNWAIAIGINQYHHLQPLNYAKRDAQLMQEFLSTEAGFNEVILFSDDSPEFYFQNQAKSSLPIRSNLRDVLRNLPQRLNMGAGDNFWFFFSGHGMRHAERDYL